MYRDEFGKMFWLALPLSLAQLAQNLGGFVDTLMVGKLGDDALAGIAIGATTFHFVALVFSGILFSVSPIISQAIGAGETDKIGRTVRQGFWISVIGFIPCFIAYWNAAPILRMLGQDEQVVQLSSGYLRAISWGLLPYLLLVSLRGLLEASSNTRPILVICLIGVGLNVFLNDALMFGKYGLPAMGLVGTGTASAIVYLLTFFMMLAYVWHKYSEHSIFSPFRWPDPKMIGEILRVGVPISGTIFFEFSMFAVCSFAMGVIGAKQLAAHQIALQTASITFMLPLGVALATTVRVGRFAGEGNHLRSKIAGQVGMMLAMGVMCIAGAIFWLFPRAIISIYLDISDPENTTVINYAIGFLGIAALFQIVDGLQVTASGSLRGLKKTREAMIGTLIAYWLIGIPACAILGFQFGGWGLGLGGTGLWYGLTTGLAAAAILLSVRFHREFRASND